MRDAEAAKKLLEEASVTASTEKKENDDNSGVIEVNLGCFCAFL